MVVSAAQQLPILEQWKPVTSAPYARPLVVRFGAMGDMVILLTLIHALHLRFRTPVDIVATGAWTRPLLESQVGVGNIYLLRTRRTPYWLSLDKQRLVAELRRRGVGPTWICNDDDDLRRLIKRAGIPSSLIVDERTYPRQPEEHFVDRWMRFAYSTPRALVGTADKESELAALPILRVPPLAVAPEWRDDLDRWLAQRGLRDTPLVLVQAGNKRTMRLLPRRRRTNTKYWPEERWAQVIDGISKVEPTAHILLLGVQAEFELNKAIQKLAHTTRTHNITGQVPIPRLLALQERALGMISVDTGPAHSAAALGCPLVVLFGSAKTAIYSPRSPTDTVEVLIQNVAGRTTMLGVQAEHVLDAWEKLRQSGKLRVSPEAAPT
jgi:ADP-heptose:LPS heptosyltransferase